MTELQKLSLEWIRQLNNQAYAAHQEYSKWHDPPLSDMDKTKLSIKVQESVETINKIVNALIDEGEKGDSQ